MTNEFETDNEISEYDQIVWPERFLVDSLWVDNNFVVIEFLSKKGKVAEWITEEQEYRYPASYLVDNVIVKFSPLSGYIDIGGLLYRVPDMESEDSRKRLERIIKLTSELQDEATKL